MSCDHYLRKCKLLAPCCNKEYICRICHDEQEEHTLDRGSVNNIICVQCSKKQEISRNCNECGILFGKYACLICRLFDDNDKKQFHCTGCGICRLGGRENFFHCPKCNICLSTVIAESHKCIEDMSRRKCPVCLEDLHSSRKKVDIPNCSHAIHTECRSTMVKHGKTSCPICYQSLIDMKGLWDKYDELIVMTPMPEIYCNYHVNILCRDCHKESKVIFHVIGLKCSDCGGYNTTRIGGDDPLPEEPPSAGENLSINLDDSWETIETEDSSSDLPNVGNLAISFTVLPSIADGVLAVDDFSSEGVETSNPEDVVNIINETSNPEDVVGIINAAVVRTTHPDEINNDNSTNQDESNSSISPSQN